MNVAMFLTPRFQVVCIQKGATMRQALERMAQHGYTAVPIVDEEDGYVGTLTEGDLLRKLTDEKLTIDDTERIPLASVARSTKNTPIEATTEIEEILSYAIDQNFVPVIDSRGVLMGIVTRKAIIQRCLKLLGADGLDILSRKIDDA